ncbi:MAG TPA: L-seryl-tRNA(Sec) selenium transferase [Caldilineales bacterium]|nr:L-seryl-tRNA(Sec) selenium transferase [Caldilineales bacterium]
MSANPYRQLPGLDALLSRPALRELIARFGRDSVRDEARSLLDDARAAIRSGQTPPSQDELVVRLQDRVRNAFAPSLLPVINATGVIVHTNLGRALLSDAAKRAMMEVASSYSNLEYDLAAGKRGSRYVHAEALLTRLTGAEAALVVNNNAAAVNLTLRTLAAGQEVIISRGELVEIGGGFRIPDILAQSSAVLVEVGTTNRTRLVDYENAITEHTGLLLKVHQSNYRIIGFTEEVGISALAGLARRKSPPIPVLHDLGSGTLLDTRPYGLAYEPRVQDSVAAGADVVTFSGDKLLGGPQAGVILGRKAIIDRLKRQPLTRAFRVDKTTLAALQATLMAYLRGTATEEIPAWRMISASAEALAQRARTWADALTRQGIRVTLAPGGSAVGGGSLPGQTLPTTLLLLRTEHPHRLLAALRAHTPPIIARVEEDAVAFDPRTVLPEQESILLAAIPSCLHGTVSPAK